MASKKSSGLIVAALVIGLLPFGAASAQAADLGTVSIDCDAANIAGATIVATGGVGDTFVIDNTGTADNCVITATALLTGEDADHDSAGAGIVTPGGGNSGVITVVGSGTFTVSSAGTGTPARSFVIDACSLQGSGVAADPWLVGTQADFQIVGVQGTSGQSYCSLSGHYLQTADLTNLEQLDDYADDKVGSSSSPFTGTYDGDHYSISLGGATSAGWNYDSNGDTAGGFSTRTALFEYVDGGTVKKVRVSGNIKSDAAFVGGLVGQLRDGGVVSEVSSGVNIESSNDDPAVGGIVAQTGTGDARVQYSKSSSDISWNPLGTPSSSTSIGGIIGHLTDVVAGVLEVRDSYYIGDVTIDSTDVLPSGSNIYVGGIIGNQDDVDGTFVRTYSVGSATDTCVNPAPPASAVCADSSSGNLRAGALGGNDQSGSVYVANYFLTSGLFQAAVGDGTAIVAYSTNLPVAVPVSAAVMKTIATYQSKESSTSAGDPSGLADLSSDPTAGGESDFRWAIEPITAQTFVPSSYDADGPGVDEGSVAELLTYTNRVNWANTSLSREYRVLRGGVLSAHGGEEAAAVVNYPALGRVWDICDDYPTLVWEENNSCTGSGGSSSSGSSSEASANPGGLSDAEYAEFLASGLTLEQFLAARLAATGPDGALLVGGGSLTLLFLAAGAIILAALGRERRLRRS